MKKTTEPVACALCPKQVPENRLCLLMFAPEYTARWVCWECFEHEYAGGAPKDAVSVHLNIGPCLEDPKKVAELIRRAMEKIV